MEFRRIAFKCCFCGASMQRDDQDVCALTLTNADDKSQTQWCHLTCFAGAAPHCDIHVTRL